MLATALLAHGPHHDDGPGWWWIGGVFHVILMILLVAFVVRVFVFRRRFGGRAGFAPWAGTGAIQVLAERYARGEIDAAEYTERLDHLRKNPPRL